MSITSVVNDLVTSVSVINALKPLPPTISGYSVGGVDDTALDPAGGQTVQINGTGFLAGATITFDGSAVAVVTYVSPNQLTFTSPAKTAGTYTIYAVNSDGGTAIFIPGIIYSVLPTWTTSAGSLGSYYETTSISNTVIATGDAPITYSLFSGSLPAGSTLYANGVITGTAPVDSSSTTYSFTIQATDAQLQDSTRSFSLTINVDAVTWVSPANNTTYTNAVDSAIANVALSATDAAGYNVSYSANALPTGLSLSGANISGTPTVIADSSTLLTATAATTNRSATRTINWSITVANDTYFEYNTLLIPGASTTFVDDASTNNFAVSIFGDTKPNSFNPYTPGYYSNYITTGAYLTTPATVANSGFSTGDFTVEAWIYPTVAQSTTIVSSNYSYSTAAGNWAFYTTVGSANTVYFNGGSSSSPSANHASTATATIPLNQWTHIAYSRTSAVGYFFINGVQLGTSVADTSGYAGATGTLYVGRQADGTGYLTGYISNLRIVKGTGVYTASFTPNTTPLTAISGTSLLTCQSNRFIDNSSNAYTLTITGSPTINSFQPFTPNSSYSTYGSGYFDGTGDYLSVASNAAFGFGTGDFSLEAWVNVSSISGYATILTNRTADVDNTAGRFSLAIRSGVPEYFAAGTGILLTSNITLLVNTWYHIAATRASNIVRIFINGISYNGTATYSTSMPDNGMKVGGNGTNEYITGYISDARVIKGTAVYTTNFTPPSAPLTAIANTSLLVLQNNQSVNNSVFLDNSTNNFLVTRAGNTTQGTFSPYGGNWSNYFDGTGDVLVGPTSNTVFQLTGNGGTGLTVEAWIYPISTSGSKQIVTYYSYTDGGAEQGWYFRVIDGQLQAGNAFGGTSRSGGSISVNTWTHVAFVINSGSFYLYVNGVSVGSVTGVGSQNYDSTTLVIGGIKQNGTNTNQVFNGYISNLRTTNTAVYTGAFTPSTSPLTAIAGTSLLTCQSNRLIDNSINNFTLTKTGDTSVQRFSPFNPSSVTATSYSGYFDGSGDYLTVPDNVALQFGTGAFTMELWFYPTATISSQILLAKGTGGDGFELRSRSSGGGNYFSFWAANGFTAIVESNVTFTLNTWQHLAVVRSSGTMTLYKNGVNVGSASDSTSFVASGSALRVAVDVTAGNLYSTGYISNVRIVKGVAVYTGAFTVPTSPLTSTQSSGTNIAAITGTSTSLLTLQSTTFIDNSTNNFTITAFGNSQPTIQNPFGYTSATTNGYTVSTIGGSGYFDGVNGSYLTIPANASCTLGTNNHTIECWYYAAGAQQTSTVLWAYAAGSTNQATNSYYLSIGNGSGNLLLGNGGAWGINIGFTSPSQNAWHHMAVVRSGNVFTLYIDGVSAGSGTYAATIASQSSFPFIIGGQVTGSGTLGSTAVLGYVTDVRFNNGTALYTSNFVPPSAPLPAIQNSLMLTNMTSAGVYDAAMMTTMQTVADAKLSTAVSKFGGSSVSFDGSGDYLSTYNPSYSLSVGSGDFTYECWLYVNALPGLVTSVYHLKNDAGLATTVFVLELTTNGAISISTGTAIIAYGTAGKITTGSWIHFAFVRTSGVFKTFFNGIQDISVANTTAYNGTYLYIGAWRYSSYDNSLNGYLDDVRITKGYARYTSNFTAPTSAFPIY